MSRRAIGAILLPLPFAALPVIVVLLGAVFGPKSSDDFVAENLPAPPAIEESVSNDPLLDDEEVSLASISSSVQFEPGCGDIDLSGT
jgi:hypothetical protein